MGLTEQRIVMLEHESGLRPLGEYPDHCEWCRIVHGCGHKELVNVYAFGSQVPIQRICERCGQGV